MPSGVKLTLDTTGRELAYGRLSVTDAKGRKLPASLTVIAPDRLAMRVADETAEYPLRIDPTFSDANWVSLSPGMPGANSSRLAAHGAPSARGCPFPSMR